MKVDFSEIEVAFVPVEPKIPELNKEVVRALLLDMFNEPREIPEQVAVYFLYEYGLQDVKAFCKEMVSDGYIIKNDDGLYMASAKGNQYAEQNAYYWLLHKHYEWGLDLKEFENTYNGDVGETIQILLELNLKKATDIQLKFRAYNALYE